MTPQKCDMTHAEWLIKQWHDCRSDGVDFEIFWRYFAECLTIPDLRRAARILKIKNPRTTPDALRKQFAVAWSR